VADDFERLLRGNRRPHRLLDIGRVTYFQDIHGLPPRPHPVTGVSRLSPPPPAFVILSNGMDAGHKGGNDRSKPPLRTLRAVNRL
jgi:hypothetical protein